MTDKAPPQLQFIDTLPPQLRLALSRYKLRRSLNQPASVEDDPDLQRLLARSSVNREIRRLRLSSLWGMVTDSLLRNGKSN